MLLDRRAALMAGMAAALPTTSGLAAVAEARRFDISLAEWSLHRSIQSGAIKHLDVAQIARRQFGIDAVEHVSELWGAPVSDRVYRRELARRLDGEGVKSLLIMRGHDQILGHQDAEIRKVAVADHLQWLDVAAEMGCHSLRVFALSTGPSLLQRMQTTAESLGKLCAAAAERKLSILIENHNGNSSNVEWLLGLIAMTDAPNLGTLPDFGNWNIGDQSFEIRRDAYAGVAALMPFARGVSAKSFAFDSLGQETSIDYARMMQVVLGTGFRGHVGIEYEGASPDEIRGIRATSALLLANRESAENHRP